MATTVLGLKTFTASDPVDYNEINDNYNKIDNGVKTALQGRAAHNLLDNSDFRNPINQRGKSSYSGSVYSIDRWKLWTAATTLTINDGYITNAEREMAQLLENVDTTKTYTLAGCTYDGVIHILQGKFDGNNYGDNYLRFVGDTSVYCVGLKPNSWVWAALYEGSYTADTLPAYVPKGYAAELAECQQRFHVYATENARPSDALDCCPPMILAPGQTVITQGTMTVDGKTLYYNSTDL